MRPARFAPAPPLGGEPRSLTRVACGETAIKEDILKRDASRLLLELETRIFDLSLFSIFGFYFRFCPYFRFLFSADGPVHKLDEDGHKVEVLGERNGKRD